MIPRNLAVRLRGVHIARRAGLGLLWAVLASAPTSQAALASLPPALPRLVKAPPIPARPLPRMPAFSYVHPARPSPAARPDEDRLLTLQQGAAQQTLTLRQLRAMPAVRYRVRHPQLGHEYTYEGVTLRDLAVMGGFAGKDLRVYASNGFVSTILARDYLNHPIMLAYLADGQPIPVLQKGPLTVVLPTSVERFQAKSYASAWVWFAERIVPAP